MKILHIIPGIGSVYGGTSKIVIELAQATGSLGLSVDIVTTNANGSTTLDVPLCKWITEKYYRIQYFPYWNFLDYKITISLTSWLFQHVSEYDVVNTHAIFSYPVLIANLACHLRRVPYVINPHGMLEPWALNYKAWKKKVYFSLLEKPALQNSGALILAPTEAKSIKALHLNTPIFAIPNGVHPSDFEISPDLELFYQRFPDTRNKTLIVFLGRIHPKKGLDLLATAFSRVHRQFPQTHLIVAGPDNTGFLPTVKNYFVKVNCSEAVTFTGMLTGSIKYAALAAASIYVAPYYSEGFSMSILEGMAAELPCVITVGCNFPEAGLAQAAYIVDIDANAIANALIQYLSNPQQAKDMGKRARQFIFNNYTWEKIAQNIINAYTKILSEKRIRSI